MLISPNGLTHSDIMDVEKREGTRTDEAEEERNKKDVFPGGEETIWKPLALCLVKTNDTVRCGARVFSHCRHTSSTYFSYVH